MGIDRAALVSRHNPKLSSLDPFSPLSLGNGDFAFTADATGLQTFLPRGEGTTPLCTMAQWGFHSYSPQGRVPRRDDLRLARFDAGGRSVGYMTDPDGQEELFSELRMNPHRLNLARLGFVCTADSGGVAEYREFEPQELGEVRQVLDLWRGSLSSSCLLAGAALRTGTAVHPGRDILSLRSESAALEKGRLGVLLAFPYGSHMPDASDWDRDYAHSSALSGRGLDFLIRRGLDGDTYQVALRLGAGCSLRSVGPHRFLITASHGILELSLEFSPGSPTAATAPAAALPLWEETRDAAAEHWKAFWSLGAAVDFSGSVDVRAGELERRVVLSQYLTAIQCSGRYPPQETGLTCNSWYGKFHLEMHYWHAAHFALWGRPALLERSLPWYREILGSARSRAASQGYRGARWPKMTDPRGEDSPSPIGPLLCWQQPHPIMYAELLRRCGLDRDCLEPYGEIVFETAEFMADYARLEETSDRYVLGSPLIPAQESHKPMDTCNPTFELEYWRWGLETALKWKELIGASPAAQGSERWKRVLFGLAVPPEGSLADGRRVYLAHERRPDTFASYAVDHPSMLLALGMLPGMGVRRSVMDATYSAVLECWDFESAWGWDFPAMAMTAARLGRRTDAVDALLMDTPKNTYRPNGHNAQLSSPSGPRDSPFLWNTKLPLYLPGNGALLLAVGMMAGGWDGDGGGAAPGFPDDGSWSVTAEGLARLP